MKWESFISWQEMKSQDFNEYSSHYISVPFTALHSIQFNCFHFISEVSSSQFHCIVFSFPFYPFCFNPSFIILFPFLKWKFLIHEKEMKSQDFNEYNFLRFHLSSMHLISFYSLSLVSLHYIVLSFFFISFYLMSLHFTSFRHLFNFFSWNENS